MLLSYVGASKIRQLKNSPIEDFMRQNYYFVAFGAIGERQREPWI
jgi:hypothetical protein